MTKPALYLAIPIVMPLLAGPVVYGQEVDRDEEAAPDSIDEVTVIAPQSLSTLRKKMEIAQEETFSVFNAMIDDPNFHISCRMQRPHKDGFDPMPIHREKRVCTTRYFRRQSQRSNEDYVDGFGSGRVSGVSAHQRELTKKFHSLIEENEEFRRVMSEYVIRKREYDAAQEQELSDDFYFR